MWWTPASPKRSPSPFAGGLGETETGGLVVNLVPKTGGNSTHGSLFFSGTGEKLQSDNLTPALKNQGVIAASPLSKVYDISGTIGGPIARDRLWYFATAHRGGSTTESTNVYYNLNAGDPAKWSYAPDSSRRAYSDRLFENASARVTWQMTRRNKVGVFWDEQTLCRTCTGATPAGVDPPRVSPEAVGVFGRPLRVAQATWSAPLSNRLLVEAGFGATYFGFANFERNPNPTRDLIRVVEQCASGCAANGNIPGLAYRSQDFSDAYNGSYLWTGSVSYVTGSHSLKVGYQHTLMTQDVVWMTNTQNLTYRFNNGVPNQLTESISPWMNRSRTGWDAVFAQERWTRGRLTLQGAVRFDRARSWFPAQQEGPSGSCRCRSSFRKRVAWTVTRTSPPGWGRPTMCSAMAARRSRYTWADTWRGRARGGHLHQYRIRRCGCRRRHQRSARQV